MSLKDLVLSCLPLNDNKRIFIWVNENHPLCRRKNGQSIEVTSTVNQLLNEGKIKRYRRYGFGRSGRAGHTWFVINK